MPGELDLRTPARVHIVGVGGAGMSGLALVLAQMGHRVSGSDLRPAPVLERLARAGVTVTVGHVAEVVEGAEWVTASPAVPSGNVELVAARAAQIPVYSRASVMAALTRSRSTVAVAGTHGKTTTSSMLSLIALEAGLAPSFLIGAEISGMGANAHWGEGDLLVIEADESYGSFSELEPALVGITNIEADHLDHYGTVDALEAAFGSLLERSGRRGVVLVDDAGAARVGALHDARTVGLSASSEVVISDVELSRASSAFRLRLAGDGLVLRVGAPGLHNVRNAAIAAVLADELGVPHEGIVAGLARFAGVPRRFEFRGDAGGVTFVDDYAHLPTEVEATLEAAAVGGFARIVAIFQPHRFTRTESVASGYAGVFAGADVVLVTDIYAAGETPIPGVTGRLVAEAAQAGLPAGAVRYVPSLAELEGILEKTLRPGDLCLTMGAGDLTALPDVMLERRR